MRSGNSRRVKTENPTSSMADIAFLLLIFFLLTTTIFDDSGILVKLPPFEKETTIVPLPARNVFNVMVNKEGKLLVEGQIMEVTELRKATKQFISNPQQLSTLPSSPKKAVVSLQNDRGTRYDDYLSVYNELRAAYNELRDEKALREHGKEFRLLPPSEKKKIRNAIPLVISEAEPTEH